MEKDTREGLAAYYGTRALGEASAGRPRNATSFAKAAVHHALESVGRFKFGVERLDGTVDLFRTKAGALAPKRIAPTRNEFNQREPEQGLCRCEMS